MAGSLWRYWMLRGHLAEGRAQLEQLLVAAADRQSSACFWEARHAAGVLAFRQGDYAAARAHLDAYRHAGRSRGDEAAVAAADMSLGRMAIDAGEFDQASALLDECLRIETALGQPLGIAWSVTYLGLLAQFTGDDVRARSLLLDSLPRLRELGDEFGVAVNLFYQGRAAYSQREYQETHRQWSESLRICSDLRYLWPQPYQLEGFGALAALSGEPLLALQLAGAADSVHEAIGAPLPPSWGEPFRRWLTATRRMVSSAEADAAWEEGRALGREEAIELSLALPITRLPQQEGPSASPSPPELRELTRREREVAALLARGLTNREIARDLGISEGTARINVERILGKLNLRSRAQFAAWVAERGVVSASPS
jgi:non-specific serine/threonine protein kinase